MSSVVLRIVLTIVFVQFLDTCSATPLDVAFIQKSEGDVSLLTLAEHLPFDESKAAAACLVNNCQDVTSDELLSSLAFTPEYLDFGEVQVGFPKELEVKVTNLESGGREQLLPVKLLSLSVSNADSPIVDSPSSYHSIPHSSSPSSSSFVNADPQYLSLYPTFFKKKYLEPGDSTTFTVTYLPKRADDKLQSYVYVHTHVGSVKLQTVAKSTANSYRLESIHSPVVPVNTSFETDITLYNPYPVQLNVTELYGSGSGFHLEPVDDEKSWTLDPYETKSVMRTSFFSIEAMNHTGFLKLTLETVQFSDSLILPIQFESSLRLGVYASTDAVDFGQIFPKTNPKHMDMLLINTYLHDVTIQSITSRNKALKVDFIGPQILPAKMQRFYKIASFHLNPDWLNSSKDSCGDIVIRLSGSEMNELKIPFRSKVLVGNLTFHKNSPRFFHFYSGSKEVKTRSITVKNNFEETLLVSHVFLFEKKAPDFRLEGFKGPIKIEAGQTVALGELKFFPRNLTQLQLDSDGRYELPSYTSEIHVSSNVSNLTLPFSCYSGHLEFKVDCVDKDLLGNCLSENETEEDEEEGPHLDFGYVSVGATKSLLLTLLNPNSVSIELNDIKWTMEDTNVTVVGGKFRFDGGKLMDIAENVMSDYIDVADAYDGFGSPDYEVYPVTPSRSKVSVAANSFVILKVSIRAPVEGQMMGGHLIMKSKYEVLQIKMHYQSLMGSLLSKVLTFQSFPYRVQKLAFTLKNNYDRDLELVHGEFQPPDPRFSFIIVNPPYGLGYINAARADDDQDEFDLPVAACTVVFNPTLGCDPKCYLGIDSQTSEGEQWVSSLRLPQDVADVDAGLLKPLIQTYDQMKSDNSIRNNITAVMRLKPMNEKITLPIEAYLEWPALAKRTLAFKLAHVGSVSTAKLEIKNPSNRPIVLQIIPVSLYQNVAKILEILSESFHFEELAEIDVSNLSSDSFFLTNSEDKNTAHNNPSIQYRADLERKLSVKPSKQTLTFFAQPNQHLSISITFNATEAKPHQSLFLVRNNLTVIDYVMVSGVAATYNFTLAGVHPVIRSEQSDDVDESWMSYIPSPLHLPKQTHLEFRQAGHAVGQSILFDLKSNYLSEHCSGKTTSPFKVKKRKSLLVSNTGIIPFSIHSVLINGHFCEASGFVVENCDPNTGHVNFSSQSLAPNDDYELLITFHPDFALTKVEAELQIFLDMELSTPRLFHLVATVPFTFIPKCAAQVPRAPWEGYLYSAVVLSMITLFFGAMITSYYDAKKLIMHTYCNSTTSQNGSPCVNVRNMNKDKFHAHGKWNQQSASNLKSHHNGAHDKNVVGRKHESVEDLSMSVHDDHSAVDNYLTETVNPDGTKGFLLNFGLSASSIKATNEEPSGKSSLSRVAKSTDNVSTKRMPVAVVSKVDAPAVTIEARERFLVSREKPPNIKRFLSAFTQMFYIQPIFNILSLAFFFIFKTFPSQLFAIVKRMVNLIMYIVRIIFSCFRFLFKSFFTFFTWILFEKLFARKKEKFTLSPEKKSRGTYTETIHLTRKQRQKRARNCVQSKTNGRKGSKGFKNEESEEHSVAAAEDKDSPTGSEVMDDQSSSRFSTPELPQRWNFGCRNADTSTRSSRANQLPFMDSNSSSRANGDENVSSLRHRRNVEAASDNESSVGGSDESSGYLVEDEESVNGNSFTPAVQRGNSRSLYSGGEFAFGSDGRLKRCEQRDAIENFSNQNGNFNPNVRIAQNSPKTGTTWGRPASSESRESSYEQDENVPPGFEDFAMHSNVSRRSSHSVVQATGNSNLNDDVNGPRHFVTQDLERSSLISAQQQHHNSNNHLRKQNAVFQKKQVFDANHSNTVYTRSVSSGKASLKTSEFSATLSTPQGLADFRKESPPSPRSVNCCGNCHRPLHASYVGSNKEEEEEEIYFSSLEDQIYDTAGTSSKEEFNKGPSQGSLRHRGVGGRHLNPDDLVSDGRQSAIGPSWRRVAAQIGEGLATSSRSPHIRENTSATSLSYFQDPFLPGVDMKEALFSGSLDSGRYPPFMETNMFKPAGRKYNNTEMSSSGPCWPPPERKKQGCKTEDAKYLDTRGKEFSSQAESEAKQEKQSKFFDTNGEKIIKQIRSTSAENLLIDSSSIWNSDNNLANESQWNKTWNSKLAPLPLLALNETAEESSDEIDDKFTRKTFGSDADISSIWKRDSLLTDSSRCELNNFGPIGWYDQGTRIGRNSLSTDLNIWWKPENHFISPLPSTEWPVRRSHLPVAPFNEEDEDNTRQSGDDETIDKRGKNRVADKKDGSKDRLPQK